MSSFHCPHLLIFKRLNILWIWLHSIFFTRVMHINHTVGNRRKAWLCVTIITVCPYLFSGHILQNLKYLFSGMVVKRSVGSSKQSFGFFAMHVRWKRVVVPHLILRKGIIHAMSKSNCLQGFLCILGVFTISAASSTFSFAVKFGTKL